MSVVLIEKYNVNSDEFNRVYDVIHKVKYKPLSS